MRADGSSCGSAGGCGCDTCGEANSSAGAQALAWAMQVQSPAARADRFWGPLAVAETVRTADPAAFRHPSPVGEAVERCAGSAVLRAAAPPWGAAECRVEPSDPGILMGDPPAGPVAPQSPPEVPSLPMVELPESQEAKRARQEELAKRPSVTVETPTGVRRVVPIKSTDDRQYRRRTKVPQGAECCVEYFLMPSDIKAWTKPYDELLIIAGWHFEVSAGYYSQETKPKDDPRICDCTCCAYEQYVTLLAETTGSASDLKDAATELVEDCVWWKREDEDEEGNVRPGKTRRVLAERVPKDPKTGRVPEDVKVLCFGMQAVPSEIGGLKPVTTHDGACHMVSCDEPQFPIGRLAGSSMEHLFMGQIVDECNNRKVKVRDFLRLGVTMDAAAKPQFSWQPGGRSAGANTVLPEPRKADDPNACKNEDKDR